MTFNNYSSYVSGNHWFSKKEKTTTVPIFFRPSKLVQSGGKLHYNVSLSLIHPFIPDIMHALVTTSCRGQSGRGSKKRFDWWSTCTAQIVAHNRSKTTQNRNWIWGTWLEGVIESTTRRYATMQRGITFFRRAPQYCSNIFDGSSLPPAAPSYLIRAVPTNGRSTPERGHLAERSTNVEAATWAEGERVLRNSSVIDLSTLHQVPNHQQHQFESSHKGWALQHNNCFVLALFCHSVCLSLSLSLSLSR